mmetsp:Transcript_23939/g.45500  ORF Transcript_23939/g.45500 Transcript_23939/m.45500 type:complete len:220 (+) Transcript_23939:3722-4381(+)
MSDEVRLRRRMAKRSGVVHPRADARVVVRTPRPEEVAVVINAHAEVLRVLGPIQPQHHLHGGHRLGVAVRGLVREAVEHSAGVDAAHGLVHHPAVVLQHAQGVELLVRHHAHGNRNLAHHPQRVVAGRAQPNSCLGGLRREARHARPARHLQAHKGRRRGHGADAGLEGAPVLVLSGRVDVRLVGPNSAPLGGGAVVGVRDPDPSHSARVGGLEYLERV